jgi:hypothetical protein
MPAGPPKYGQPGSPSYGQYGQGQPEAPPPPQAPPGQQAPWGGQPAYGQQPYGQPQYGQPQYGQPPSGQPPYGQPQYGQPQYGQPPYQPGPSGLSPIMFARTSGLGTAAIVLAVLLTITYWLAAALSPSADGAVEDAVASGGSATNLVTSYDVVNLLSLPIMIAAWVVTSLWLGRIRQNALVVAPQGQRRSAVWAWIGWIVPVVSWWFPKQILDDSITSTRTASGVSGPGGAVTAPGGRALPSTTPYWAAWVVLNLLNNLEFRITFQAKPENAIIPALEVAIAVAATVALVLWIPIVQRLSAAQDALAQNQGMPR